MINAPFDVIIVLGAAQNADGSPGPAIERRVRHAVGLFNDRKAPVILMSGGVTQGPEPEAQAMARLAIDAGVPAVAVHKEIRSTRTFENAVECRNRMSERGWRRALVVSDNFHMRRAMMCFEGLNVTVEGSPVRNRLSPYVVAAYVREFFARQLYSRMIHAYRNGRT